MWAVTEPRDKLTPPMLLTVDQLAERLEVDLSRIYELLRSYHLPFVKIAPETSALTDMKSIDGLPIGK